MSFIKGKGFVHDADALSQIADDPAGALQALTPNRILYVADLPATWFNGTQTDLIGVIPLTADESVVGTKIRVRGVIRVPFQGIAPNFGGEAAMAVVFNVAADAANQFEGVSLIVNGGVSSVFTIDAELELKAASSGKFKVGLGSNTPTYIAIAQRAGTSLERWGSEGDTSLFIADPTIDQSIGGTEGLVVQLQIAGGTTNQSICNFVCDVSYEITPP